MNTYIALLRGINVSGKNKILMTDLKAILNILNFKNVITYIQSGNIIFETDLSNKIKISTIISDKIKENYNYDVPVIIKTPSEFKKIITNNPFLGKKDFDSKKTYIAYLSSIPKDIQKLNDFDFGQDKYIISKDIIYLYYNIGAGKTKLTNRTIESKLNVIATSRNWRTTSKLFELVQK